jgi:outer membrane biosynthesis protein TonB
VTRAGLSREEAFGLGLAALGHVALVWVLVTAPAPEPLPPVDRVSVTLSDEMGPVSTAPNPQSDPMADKGPELGEPAPVEEAVPAPPMPKPQPQPAPVPAPQKAPAPKPAPAPPQKAPAPKPQAKPQPAKAAPTKAVQAKATPAKAGASSFDQAFAKGIPGGSTKGRDQSPAASQASAQQVASWSSSINSKVRGPWNSCPVSGLDVGKLRASVRFTLDKTGRVQSIEDFDVTGVTEANRPQVKPFKDCAVRAIRLAAPFAGLPPEFHDQWKNRRLNFRKE